MKNFKLFGLLLMALCSFTFSACSSDDDDKGASFTVANLVGEWTPTKIVVYEDGHKYTMTIKDNKYTDEDGYTEYEGNLLIKEDGTVYTKYSEGSTNWRDYGYYASEDQSFDHPGEGDYDDGLRSKLIKLTKTEMVIKYWEADMPKDYAERYYTRVK